jgi:DNA-binding NarL/FixJ family response regulator
MKRLRILLVDDHVLVREGLKRVLGSQPDLDLVGEAADGTEAIALARQLEPDVVLMDLSLPVISGIDVTRQLVKAQPALRILALTVHESEAYVSEFLRAGAHGYLLKRSTTEELLRAIRGVGGGQAYIDPRVSQTLVDHLVSAATRDATMSLSERETEVLRLTAFGYANKEMAARLNLSVKSIETYKARAMEKLGLRDRVDIVTLARQRGWFAT